MGCVLQMRVLIDHSCVEIYLSSGEVLSTRVYRGQQPADSDAGIDFVAFGGTAKVEVSKILHGASFVLASLSDTHILATECLSSLLISLSLLSIDKLWI